MNKLSKKEYKFLTEVNSQSLQKALKDLDNAYSRFFKKTSGYPNFKSKDKKNSFHCPQFVSVSLHKGKLFLPPKNHQFINFRKTVVKIARQLNISPRAAEKQLRNFTPPAHRLTVKKVNRNLIILDDTYNSNPAGFKLALDKLQKLKSDQKILITPGMIELGSMQFSENARLATIASKICDHIIIVGQTNQEALLKGAKSAQTKVKIHPVPDLKSAQELLPSIMSKTSAILYENDLSDNYF